MKRTAIFVDHENLSICARNRGALIDFYDLKEYLASEQEGRMPLESFCYVAIDPRNEHAKDHEIQRMEDDGWFVKMKRGAPCTGGKFKCNVDIELAIDMVSFAYDAKPDIVILVSGDQDFTAVVRKLRQRGIRVEVAAFPENISHVLLNAASSFINLEAYLAEIRETETTETSRILFVDKEEKDKQNTDIYKAQEELDPEEEVFYNDTLTDPEDERLPSSKSYL